MATKSLNVNLQAARKAKKDEFYTQLSDIEKECSHYKDHFRGKVVYCNCDDPTVSNFFRYFALNFQHFGLQKLVATCFQSRQPHLFSQNDSPHGLFLEYNGDLNGNSVPDPEEIGVRELKGDGDFRSPESIELLKQADIVVTNPPFSLFREYVAQLVEYDKKFLIIGNKNCITFKDIFTLIKENKLWLGYRNINQDMWFVLPYEAEKWEKIESGQKVQHIMGCWFTNLDHSKRHEDLILYKPYSPEEYPTYVNYNAINVDKVADIPVDYDGAMGVPITFLGNYNPAQFEIVGSSMTHGKPMAESVTTGTYTKGGPRFYLDNGDGTYRRMYDRLVIKRRQA